MEDKILNLVAEMEQQDMYFPKIMYEDAEKYDFLLRYSHEFGDEETCYTAVDLTPLYDHASEFEDLEISSGVEINKNTEYSLSSHEFYVSVRVKL